MCHPEYKDSNKAEYQKLAVCITFHYVEERIKYFAEVCRSLIDIAPIVHLTIVTNTNENDKISRIESLVDKEKIHLEFLIPHGLGHPYLLAWSHLEVFRKKINETSYSHFLYLEDDMKITSENIAYWLDARSKLKNYGLIPAFFRIEENTLDGKLYSTDVMQKMSMYECPVFDVENGNSFISIIYPFQGLYLLDRDLMYEHLNGPTSCPDFDHSDGGLLRVQSHDLRARAALGLTFVGVPSGFRSRYILPFDKQNSQIKPVCFVHHLPNNYTNNPETPIGKIKVDDIFIPKSINTYFRKKINMFVKTLIGYFVR